MLKGEKRRESLLLDIEVHTDIKGGHLQWSQQRLRRGEEGRTGERRGEQESGEERKGGVCK